MGKVKSVDLRLKPKNAQAPSTDKEKAKDGVWRREL